MPNPTDRLRAALRAVLDYEDDRPAPGTKGAEVYAEAEAALQPPTVYIIWGTHYEDEKPFPVRKYTFDSQQELDAFLQGAEESSGWMDYYRGDTEAYAREAAGDDSGKAPETTDAE